MKIGTITVQRPLDGEMNKKLFLTIVVSYRYDTGHKGTSDYSFGHFSSLIQDKHMTILGTCLKAKSHLPRGKKSFELAQKLVRLGANQIKMLS